MVLTIALTSSGAKDFLSVPAWTSTIGLSLVPAMTNRRKVSAKLSRNLSFGMWTRNG